MKLHDSTLKNGLRVLLVDTKAHPSLTTLLVVGAGSRYENEDNNGVAHFLEHMFFKGSQKYPDPFTLTSTIEGLGGVWNAFTSKDYTGYFIKATNEHFDVMIDVLSDVLLNPLFKNEEIEKEKGVIVEEINMYEDMPQTQVADLFENLLYCGNPLGFDTIGTKKTVTSFNRSTFVDYRSQLYHPQNAVLVVAGGFDQVKSSSAKLADKVQNYLEIIEQKFNGWNGGVKAEFEPVKEEQVNPQLLIKNKKTEQAHFCLGFRAFSYNDARRSALEVLAAILGIGASSKLFTEVREKRGLCYYIGTGIQYYHDCGNIVTQAGVPKEIEKVKEAVRVTLDEHYQILKNGFSDKEIRKAKEILKGRFLLSMEDSFNVAHFYGKKAALEAKIESPEELVERIEKVTKAEVLQVAQDLLRPENLNFAIVGPFEKKEEFEKILTV